MPKINSNKGGAIEAVITIDIQNSPGPTVTLNFDQNLNATSENIS